MATFYPFARPLYVMAKPAGAHCNLRCNYCYYLEKQHLYEQGTRHQMSDNVLEHYVRSYIETNSLPDVLFTWHGGEPLMRPLSFYRRAVQLQQYYGRGRRISNCIQTNGLLLTPEWCRFLHDEGWLVGISIDGPREMHDAYRVDREGGPSWRRVMDAIDLLNEYQVEWNAMATVNSRNVEYPHEFYRFFRHELGCQYLQFTPVVERLHQHRDGRHLAGLFDEDCPLAPFSIRPEQWGRFLCAVYDDWVHNDVGEFFVQMFDATLAGWMGVEPGLCTLARECGHAAVMEYNGDVYSCDHFVFPQFRLGNLLTDGLPAMLYGDRQNTFSRLKEEGLPRQCRQCPWLKACHGECPRLRFLHTADGEPGLNYLCAGYQQFFQHAAPTMDLMRQELLADRPASGVMQLIQ